MRDACQLNGFRFGLHFEDGDGLVAAKAIFHPANIFSGIIRPRVLDPQMLAVIRNCDAVIGINQPVKHKYRFKICFGFLSVV